MPATTIPVFGMKLGFVGSISKEGLSLRSARLVNLTDSYNISYGEAVTGNANNSYSSIRQFIANGGTFTAATPLAIAASNVHTSLLYPAQGSQSVNTSIGFYIPGQVCDACVIGTINVQINVGTPTGAFGNVYVRVALNVAIPAGVIGGFEAVADGSNTVLRPDLKFTTGYLESDGTAQVTILTRTLA